MKYWAALFGGLGIPLVGQVQVPRAELSGVVEPRQGVLDLHVAGSGLGFKGLDLGHLDGELDPGRVVLGAAEEKPRREPGQPQRRHREQHQHRSH